MEFLPVFVKKRRQRRERQALLAFIDLLTLSVESGLELTSAWREVLPPIQQQWKQETEYLTLQGNRLVDDLQRLAQHGKARPYSIWFALLGELYTAGAAIAPALIAFGKILRTDHTRELDQHIKRTPLLIQILLIFFTLPSILTLLLAPLLHQLLTDL